MDQTKTSLEYFKILGTTFLCFVCLQNVSEYTRHRILEMNITYAIPVTGLAIYATSAAIQIFILYKNINIRYAAPIITIPLWWELYKQNIQKKKNTKKEFMSNNIINNITGVTNTIFTLTSVYQILWTNERSTLIKSIVGAIVVNGIMYLGNGGIDVIFNTTKYVPKLLLIGGTYLVLGLNYKFSTLDFQKMQIQSTGIGSTILNGIQFGVCMFYVQQFIVQPKILENYIKLYNMAISLSFYPMFIYGYLYQSKQVIRSISVMSVFYLLYLQFKVAPDIVNAIFSQILAYSLGKIFTNTMYSMSTIDQNKVGISVLSFLLTNLTLIFVNQSISYGSKVPIPTWFYQKKHFMFLPSFFILLPQLLMEQDKDIRVVTVPEISFLTVLSFIALFVREKNAKKKLPNNLSTNSFKLISFNIRLGYDRFGNDSHEKLITFLQNETPIICCFQEMNGLISVSKFKDLIGSIEHEVGFYFDKDAINDNYLYYYDAVFPVTCSFIKPQSHSYLMLHSNYELMKRYCEKSIYSIGNKKIHIWNIHISAFNYEDRHLQFMQILNGSKLIDEPHIICGDFNFDIQFNDETSELVSMIPEKYLNNQTAKQWFLSTIDSYGFQMVGNDLDVYPITFKDFQYEGTLDYIIYSKHLKASDFKVVSTDISDHNPVVVNFSF